MFFSKYCLVVSMARMHSRKRGKSSSKKPVAKPSYAWVQISKDEIYSIVERLAREGKGEAQIGLLLRDQYGVPSVKAMTGKTISEVLKEKNLAKEYPSDLIDLVRKAVRLRKHLKGNNRDDANWKKLNDTESKIKRLVSYYRGGKLPAGWKYSPEEAALLVR